ncbi:cytochrome c5 family protein [Psychrobacter sp. GP33]|uniref:c-type cytochrome n=1 Tax=Psychrobacter sp. GP33 TaxID=2758709 RepID=UPI0015FBEE3D|nr:c-type cytochrome [Psychrobacter sp. GP33]
MDINQQLINKKSLNIAGKLTWSALGLSAMLALSACSGDKAVEEPVVEDVPAVEVVEEPVVEEAPVVEAEPVVEAAPVEETATAEAEGAVATEVLAADAGEQLYNAQCMACHAAGLLNAPKFGDKEAWAPRIAKGKDTLHMHSAKGFNQMPAQAANGVSEAQVYAAVDYMIAAAS